MMMVVNISMEQLQHDDGEIESGTASMTMMSIQ
jgi:hypothetical protein